MAAGRVCETRETCETGEKAVLPASEQIEVLTGLTGLIGLPHFPLSIQERHFEAGRKKLTDRAKIRPRDDL
jgi:hypothetical protein